MTTHESRAAYEAMVKIERRTLNWQRETDQGYEAIVATLNRIADLNERIANLGMGRTTSFGRNSR